LPGIVLTLTYGAWRGSYPLLSSHVWIPIGRGLVEGGRRSSVRLPDYMKAVPRGTLIELCHYAGDVRLRRSNNRKEYLVRVDGRPLSSGHPVTAAAAGSIAYGSGSDASTELDYALTPEGRP
jgi:hypothetical protein